MSHRLALIQLHNTLLSQSGLAPDVLRRGLDVLGFGNTLLADPVKDAGSEGRLGEGAVKALLELAGVDSEPRLDAVAPIEKLHLLIRLARGPAGALSALGAPQEKAAVEALALTLLEPEARTDPKQVQMLLAAIDQVGDDEQVIRIPDLESGTQLKRIAGPTPPRLGTGQRNTVGDIFSKSPGLRLLKSLAEHPVVDVEARIYKALVNGNAEFPVHLRTTIRFTNTTKDVADFDPLLHPEKWPTFNSFWAAMNQVGPGSTGVGALTQTEFDKVIEKSDAYDAFSIAAQWSPLGPFHEQVGFKDPAARSPATPDLYPDTYLHFVRNSSVDRALLTYTLLLRQTSLGVDDGCIEIKRSGGGIDVITTKSLYVSGVGSDTELAGILAYLAAYCGCRPVGTRKTKGWWKMTMKAAVDEVSAAVKAAADDASTAYDALIDELKKPQPTADAVLNHSQALWTSSLKAWANLMLAPAKIAAVITTDGAP
jgi:hypothetical protein